jgi:hypothetical protein
MNLNALIKNKISEVPHLWVQKYRTLKGKPYRFFDPVIKQAQRPFLVQMLDDQHPKKTCEKSRQAGVSENNVSEILYLCNRYSFKKFMYLFPTRDQMRDFVRSRVDSAIEESPYIKMRVCKDKNSQAFKRVANCDLFFRSGGKGNQAEGVDSDGVWFDERDRMTSSNLDAFRQGLKSSDLALIRDVSTPSLPGYGVDISFQLSDKKYWFVRCTKCGHWQNIQFSKSIVKIKAECRYAYRCLKCSGIDCIDRTNGEWVPEITDRQCEWSGYHLSQLDCPWIPLEDILKDYKRMIPQLFFNYVLGLPYVGSNLLIVQSDINNSIDSTIESIQKTGQYVIGVDWGDTSWAVVGKVVQGKLLIVHYERLNYLDPELHIKRVLELIDSWKAQLCVCDKGYGRDRNSILIKERPNIVWECYYVDGAGVKILDNQWNSNSYRITSNRTVTLKVMSRAWRSGEFILPKRLVYNNKESKTYFDHLKSLAIKVNEISEGVFWESVGNMGPDHFAHATNYALIAMYKIINRNYGTLGFLDSTLPSKIVLP